MWIDTHAHLYLKDFHEDLGEVVDRCAQHDVTEVILPNIDVDSLDDLGEVCRRFPQLFRPALGLHPCSVKDDWEVLLDVLNAELDRPGDRFPGHAICGIGEIGLDYYWDTTFKAEQQEALRIQIEWAKQRRLPVILHCRDAFEDLIRIVEETHDEQLTGIFHCFSGTSEEADRIFALDGFYVGLGGVLTFKKSQELRETAARLPIDRIVLETDAPYLTPAPHRGKRNESSYVRHVGEVLADLRRIPVEAIAKATSENARKIFGAF